MRFSERAGLRAVQTVPDLISGDAPESFRRGAIKASVDFLGWESLRQVAVDAIDTPPKDIVDWYQDCSESYAPLLYCPWWMFYDVLEAVSRQGRLSVPQTEWAFFLSALFSRLGPVLERVRAFELRVNTLFRVHNIAYSLSDCKVISHDLADAQQLVAKGIAVAKQSDRDALSRAWDAINKKPSADYVGAAEAMRSIVEDAKSDPLFVGHERHSSQNQNQERDANWHLSEVAYHAFRAASKFLHRDESPTRASAIGCVAFGAALIVYRDACKKDTDEESKTAKGQS